MIGIDQIPVYIVSGYMRSGTSMMMKCLEAGGMKAKYNASKDRVLNNRYAQDVYQPNPGGFYELGPWEFNAPDFPQIYAGKLIKVLHWRLSNLPLFNYKIIFMLRNPQEIEVSYLKMFQRRPPFVLYKYNELINEVFGMLKERKDTDVLPIQHRDVVFDPVAVFSSIRKKYCLDIDIESAAAAVDPALYRSRGEDLNKVRRSIPGLRTDIPDFIQKP